MKRFSIVGSGPSGMYTAKYLLKQFKNCKIDIFESLPTPYGLIRYGVAPDHADVKSVEVDFDTILSQPRVNYFGNVSIGTHIDINTVKNLYSAVFLCYGANGDKDLSLTPISVDQRKANIYSAREFVYWYNNHPHYSHILPELFNSRTAVIVGNGNVAIDCARILTKSVDELKTTDISCSALEILNSSSIEKLNIVGRRGPIQAAFTIKEIRELSRLNGSFVSIPKQQFESGLNEYSLKLKDDNRAKKRMFELMKSLIGTKADNDSDKKIELNFLLSPEEAHLRDGKVFATTFSQQQLTEESEKVVKDDNLFEITFPSDLLIKSVGFKGQNFEKGFEDFDETNGQLKHKGIGHIKDNLFTAGWIKRGATGIVGTNIVCAKQTISSLNEIELKDSKFETEDIKSLLASRNVQFVEYEGWKRIDNEEVRRGKLKRKTRDKIATIDEMLKIAHS